MTSKGQLRRYEKQEVSVEELEKREGCYSRV